MDPVKHAMSKVPKGGKLLYLALAGSHAYGLNTPESDIDYRGVYMTSPDHLLGLHADKGTIETKDPDLVLHELGKFCKLSLACNPNVIEQLFLDEDDIFYVDPMFQKFLNHRKSFLSRLARNTYGGYARSQIHRLKSPGTRKMGEKRKALRAEHGYDTKNAMHCIRLLWQGNLLLTYGELKVRFGEEGKEVLMDIRNGKEEYEELEGIAEQWLISLDEAMEKSPLPEKPDYNTVETLLMEARLEYLLYR